MKKFLEKLDFGFELGGLMFNPLFVDIMLINFWYMGKGYSLFHLSYGKQTKTVAMDYLFCLKYREGK
jgi:hypothetical protein